MANRRNGAIYTGVTSDQVYRASQHQIGETAGFTRRYGCKLLVWFELHTSMEAAILREKQLKAGARADKMMLIEAANPLWRDLYGDIL
jgi:putative endonuclease